ncbi:MAG: hypothetical protein ABIK20_05820, partial [Candidatus Omnitrophota bacterium]
MLIGLFFLFSTAPHVSSENSFLNIQSLPETSASPFMLSPFTLSPNPAESKKTAESAIPNQTLLFIDHLSAIEKIFNPSEKIKLFEEELQKIYTLQEQLKKPEVSSEVFEETKLQLNLSFSR